MTQEQVASNDKPPTSKMLGQNSDKEETTNNNQTKLKRQLNLLHGVGIISGKHSVAKDTLHNIPNGWICLCRRLDSVVSRKPVCN